MRQDVETKKILEHENFGIIFDVNLRAKDYFFKKYLTWMKIAAVIFLFYLMWSIAFFYPRGNGVIGVLLLFLVIFLFLYKNVKVKMVGIFMAQFAKANNMSYQANGMPENLESNFFELGGFRRSGQNLILGNFKGLPLSLFNYKYVTGHLKSKRVHYFTILRLDLQTPLPPLILSQQWMWSSSGVTKTNSNHEMKNIILEEVYDDDFSLFSGEGFEVEALQIFDFEFLAKMKNDWKVFSLEFINDYVYIFHRGYITNNLELGDMYSLAQYLLTIIKNKADRLKTEVVEMERRQLA